MEPNYYSNIDGENPDKNNAVKYTDDKEMINSHLRNALFSLSAASCLCQYCNLANKKEVDQAIVLLAKARSDIECMITPGYHN